MATPRLSDKQPEVAKVAYADMYEAAQRALEGIVAASRVNINAFMQFVMKDKKGRRFIQTDFHKRWQSAWTRHERCILEAPIEHGKTEQLVGRILWEIGQNPNCNIIFVSNTVGQATKVTAAVKKHIEENNDYHLVFPEVSPDISKWTESQFTVKRDTIQKDPTVQAVGLHGAIQGARCSLLIIDDILDFENTRTPALLEDTIAWFKAAPLTRVIEGGRVWFIGTPWVKGDIQDHVRKSGTYHFEVTRARENGKSIWWPDWRLEEREKELGSIESQRQLYCNRRDDSTSRWRQQWIDLCLHRGRGLSTMLEASAGEKSMFRRIVCGVDLSSGKKMKKKRRDFSSFFVVGVKHDGSKQVLCIEVGRLKAPEILKAIRALWRRYKCVFGVEDNATQVYIQQLLEDEPDRIPIIGLTTSSESKDPEKGVELIASEMERGEWIIPCGSDGLVTDAEIDAWIGEMLYYDPTSHLGDRLSSCYQANRIINERVISKKPKPIKGGLIRRNW